MTTRIILVTREGCPHCTRFLAGPWPALKDKLSKVRGITVEHIDVARDGIDKVPPAIRRHLQGVPYAFMLRPDGSVQPLRNPPSTPAGVKELESWADVPPTSSTVREDDYDDSRALVEIPAVYRKKVVAVTSTTCPHCKVWEESGDLKNFLASITPEVDRTQYNIDPRVIPKDEAELARRRSLVNIGVPTVIVVDKDKWDKGLGLKQSDIIHAPFDVRYPANRPYFKRWLELISDPVHPFLGFMMLMTSPKCGYCREWKDNGGMDEFIKQNSHHEGILLMHNPPALPPEIQNAVRGTPSVLFVSVTREIIQGPDVRNPTAIREWVSKIQSAASRWKNDTEFVPPEYRSATSGQQHKTTTRSSAAIQRQVLR